MSCKICSITNGKLRQALEDALLQFDGTLPRNTKAKLCTEFPEFVTALDAISAHDCEMHFNFHQAVGRSAQSCSILAGEKEVGEAQQSTSIAGDVGKDEAEILLDLLNTQYATFTAITNKIKTILYLPKTRKIIGTNR